MGGRLRSLARRLNPLAVARSLREGVRAVPELADFWSRGGIRLVQPVPRAEGPPALMSLLLQPDGDVVLSVPRRFGIEATDAEAAAALFVRADAALHRIGGTWLGALAELPAALAWVVLAGLWVRTLWPPWTAAILSPVAWLLLPSAALALLGTVARPRLRALAKAAALAWIRRRMR